MTELAHLSPDNMMLIYDILGNVQRDLSQVRSEFYTVLQQYANLRELVEIRDRIIVLETRINSLEAKISQGENDLLLAQQHTDLSITKEQSRRDEMSIGRWLTLIFTIVGGIVLWALGHYLH